MSTVIPFDPHPRGLPLRPEHREHLRTSGLSDETIAAARLASVNPAQARRLGYARGLSGIAFPYPDTEIVVDGEARAYTRLRVDAERARAPGRRYENPLRDRIERGLTFYPYVPEAVSEQRQDAHRVVVVTEGEKKALKLTQEGFPAIGIPGVHMLADPESRKAPGDKPLHPDLRRWAWRGRDVLVCFDSDRTEKEGVALACEWLCAALTREGALVRLVVLPRLPGIAKTGADDFLVLRGSEAFGELAATAQPWEPFAWVTELLPEALPSGAVEVTLGPLKRHLAEASREELTAAAARLAERYPELDAEQALALLAPVKASATPDAPVQVVTNGRQLRDVGDPEQRMLFAALGQEKRPVAELGDFLRELWAEAALRDELGQLLGVLDDRRRHVTRQVEGLPLRVHAHYTRAEVSAALGLTTDQGKLLATQAGVYRCDEHRCDLFFVTLDKHEKDFTPTTLYEDYPISPTLFHWESQSRTREDSETGLRYQAPPDGWRLFLFVRRTKRDERGITSPFLRAPGTPVE